MKKTLESSTKIRFKDCDPYNHLNNSSYIDYFINAREDQILENYELDMYEHIRKNAAGWVVGSNQIAYFKPAFLMEEVIIESELIYYSDSDLLVEMRMLDLNKTHLKSIFWSKFTYFDLQTQKRKAHPENLMELFKEVINPTEHKTFEQRCAWHMQLQKSKKESLTAK